MENVRNEYGGENLDKIFRYFMRTVLIMEKKSLLDLPPRTMSRGSPFTLTWTWLCG